MTAGIRRLPWWGKAMVAMLLLARWLWRFVVRDLAADDEESHRDAILEIRAGTGGDEATLFAADLMRMYQRLAEREGWTIELMSLSEGIPGSIREVIFTVRGRGIYGRLRYES